MISLPEFVEYVIDEWRKYLTLVSKQVDFYFADMDMYHKRNCLNYDQFFKVMEVSFRMSVSTCLSPAGRSATPQEVFNEAIVKFEQDPENLKD